MRHDEHHNLDDIDSDVTKYSLSVDGVWNFNDHETGLFALATVGYENLTWKLSFAGFSESESYSGLAYGAGFGYNFTRNFGAEAKYVIGPKVEEGTNNHVQVSVTYRF